MSLSSSTSFDKIANPQYRTQQSTYHVRSENFGLTKQLSFSSDFQSDMRHSEISDRTTISLGGDLNLIVQIAKQIHREELFAISVSPRDESVIDALCEFGFLESSVSETRNIEKFHRVIALIRDQLSRQISLTTPNTATNNSEEQADLIAQISSAINYEEVFSILDLVGHRGISERLRDLYAITLDQDPEDPAMDFQSLRELALFFVRDDILLPDPEIGISPDGFLQVEWSSSKASALIKFLPDGSVRFAGISSPLGSNEKRQAIQGSGSKELALQSATPFIINSPEDETRPS